MGFANLADGPDKSQPTYVDVLFANERFILRIRPIGVHVLDSVIHPERIERVVESQHQLSYFLVKESIINLKMWRQRLVLICIKIVNCVTEINSLALTLSTYKSQMPPLASSPRSCTAILDCNDPALSTAPVFPSENSSPARANPHTSCHRDT